MVWDVRRSADGTVIGNLARKRTYVNRYSSHIMDPVWGHLTIKMAGHAPFGAQVILNGHEYVAIAAHNEEVGFTKEGNCFTEIADPPRLAQLADTLPQDAAAGRLGQVIDRWICTACLIFGLDLADQQRTCFTYAYSATRPNTAVTCCLPTAVTWTGCSTPCWTGPGPAWTSRPCGPCSGPGYSTRQAAYDLCKLRGKQLVGKPSRTRRYYLPGPAARTISTLLTLRDHVIARSWPASRSAGTTTSRPG